MKVDRQALGEKLAGASTPQPRASPALVGDRGEPFELLREIAGERLVGELCRYGEPLARAIADKARSGSLSEARAVGKVDAVSLQDGGLQRPGLSLAGGDRGKTEPHPFLDDDPGLAAFFAETARK